MSSDIEKMRERILLMSDPNSGYTQDDFNKEFGYIGGLSESQLDSLSIPVKFTNKTKNPDPEYATAGSSGFDIRANIEPYDVVNHSETIVVIPPNKTAIIPTGLFFELPENFEIQIRPRSGLAAKHSVTVLNAPGTIDADYRGEIKVILINHGESDFMVSNGDRIAQGVISPVVPKNIIILNRVNDIKSKTVRGDGGFGSTGKN